MSILDHHLSSIGRRLKGIVACVDLGLDLVVAFEAGIGTGKVTYVLLVVHLRQNLISPRDKVLYLWRLNDDMGNIVTKNDTHNILLAQFTII